MTTEPMKLDEAVAALRTKAKKWHALATEYRGDFESENLAEFMDEIVEAADTIDRLTSSGEAYGWVFQDSLDPSREPLFTRKPYVAEVWRNAHGTVTPVYASPREGHVEVPEHLIAEAGNMVRALIGKLRKGVVVEELPLGNIVHLTEANSAMREAADAISRLSTAPAGDVTEAQAAYALLWRIHTTDEVIHAARRSLLETIGKHGQRAALQWALDTFGPTEPAPEDMP